MTGSDKNILEISIPGEWAIKKACDPVLSRIDSKRLYLIGPPTFPKTVNMPFQW